MIDGIVPVEGFDERRANNRKGGGKLYTGQLINRFDKTVTEPSLAIFSMNRVGRPLGVATSKTTTDLPTRQQLELRVHGRRGLRCWRCRLRHRSIPKYHDGPLISAGSIRYPLRTPSGSRRVCKCRHSREAFRKARPTKAILRQIKGTLLWRTGFDEEPITTARRHVSRQCRVELCLVHQSRLPFTGVAAGASAFEKDDVANGGEVGIGRASSQVAPEAPPACMSPSCASRTLVLPPSALAFLCAPESACTRVWPSIGAGRAPLPVWAPPFGHCLFPARARNHRSTRATQDGKRRDENMGPSVHR